MKTKTFENLGKKIFYYVWDDVEKPRGVVQIVHGMVEYAGRYQKVAEYFNKEGYVVVADDHRGHGKTDEDNLGYCAGSMFFDTISDLKTLMDITKKSYENLPYVLFGFSYGSFLAQYFISQYGGDLDGVIIGGSNKNPKFLTLFGQFVSYLGKGFKGEKAPGRLVEKLTFGAYNSKFEDGCFLSTNKENNAKYAKDKFCQYTCSYNFYHSFFKGLNSLYSRKYKKALVKGLPMLIVSGSLDPVGDMGKGTTKLYLYNKKVGCENVRLVLYPESRHEFLNEDINRCGDLVRWIEDNIIDK